MQRPGALTPGRYCLGLEGHVVVDTAVILLVALLLLATLAEECHFVGDDLDATERSRMRRGTPSKGVGRAAA